MFIMLLVFVFSLYLVVKGATLSIKFSSKVAENYNISKYVVGFIMVAFIAILPETFIAVNSSLKGIPEFGLGTLLGANIADLTLIFALLTIISGRGIKVESKILHNIRAYPFFLALPIILGLDGHYSRVEGLALILSGVLFYYFVFRNGVESVAPHKNRESILKYLFFLAFALLLLLAGSHFTVYSAQKLAYMFNITPILIGMLVVSLGTTMPEFFYSLKALKNKDDCLAVGDILGTVLANATIVIGILAIIDPFYFPAKIIYVTGVIMVASSFMLIRFMRSGHTLTRMEGMVLLMMWITYVFVEYLINQ